MLSSWYVLVSAAWGVAHGGYLDRVVQYRKQKFIDALKERLPPLSIHGPLPPLPSDVEDKDTDVIHITAPGNEVHIPQTDLVNITARIAPQPAGFKDSPRWDVASVSRLLDLLRVSKSGRRVLRTLRRSMQPSRRWMLSKQLSYKLFPNVNEGNYYESDNDAEYYTEEEEENEYPQMMGQFTEDSVVIVANPVEARLPSGHISIAMLRKIMEQRAEAGRVMPSTTAATVTWKTKTRTAGNATTKDGGNTTDVNETAPSNGTLDEAALEETTPQTGDDDAADPAAPNADPAAPNADPAAPNSDPAAPNADPAAPNSDPAAPNADPAAPNADPAAPDADPAAPDGPPGA